MRYDFWTLVGIIQMLLQGITTSASFSCTQVHHCNCSRIEKRGEHYFELACPSFDQQLLQILYRPGTNLLLSCSNERTLRNVTLPILEDQFLKTIEIKNCHMNMTIDELMTTLQINSTKVELQEIHLTNTGTVSFSNDSLRDLVNLRNLTIEENTIHQLFNYQFHSFKELTHLYLPKNNITSIPQYTFRGLKNLCRLHLWSNHIKELKPGTFDDLKNLTSLELMSNKLETLTENIFSKLTNLLKINLSLNPIKNLPSSVFYNNVELIEIYLRKSNITELPETFFKFNTKLEIIRLSENNLTEIMSGTFDKLTKLWKLELQSNSLKSIPPPLFSNNQNLKILNLSKNQLRYIDNNTFENNVKLQVLDLSQNSLSFPPNGVAMRNLPNLETLNLYHNDIQFVLDTRIYPKLKVLDLSYNKISSIEISAQYFAKGNIYLNNNLISSIFVPDMSFNESVSLDLRDNPFECGCDAFNFIEFTSLISDLAPLEVKIKKLTCKSPIKLAGISVADLSPRQIECETANCPTHCYCITRPDDGAYVVNCSERSLTELPTLVKPARVKFIEVYLQGNLIKTLPKHVQGYDSVTYLNLSSNLIDEVSWIWSHLKTLNLSGNRIKTFSKPLLDILNKSNVNILLQGNPWKCDCKALHFINFVKEFLTNQDIRCDGNGTLVRLIFQINPCLSNEIYLLTYIFVLVSLFSTFALFFVFYYKFTEEIKLWCYAHNIMLRWHVDDSDTSRPYDAFISYSDADLDYAERLVRNLEEGPKRFKICIAPRDWNVGDFIPELIQNSVNNSRRTIIILSSSFMDSVWNEMEFRAAHVEAVSERRTRLIIIVKGDLKLQSLDKELRAFLKTHTYVKSDDTWFWERLYYAMPRKPSIVPSKK